jgi:hypothetical protein
MQKRRVQGGWQISAWHQLIPGTPATAADRCYELHRNPTEISYTVLFDYRRCAAKVDGEKTPLNGVNASGRAVMATN